MHLEFTVALSQKLYVTFEKAIGVRNQIAVGKERLVKVV